MASRVSRLSWIWARLRSRVSRALAASSRRPRPAGARLGLGALAVLAQAVGHRDAFGGDRLEGLAGLAEEGGELAIGDGEGEGRVAILVAGDQRVDAEHPAALVEQRPAANGRARYWRCGARW